MSKHQSVCFSKNQLRVVFDIVKWQAVREMLRLERERLIVTVWGPEAVTELDSILASPLVIYMPRTCQNIGGQLVILSSPWCTFSIPPDMLLLHPITLRASLFMLSWRVYKYIQTVLHIKKNA